MVTLTFICVSYLATLENLKVSNILHKATIDVDTEGTEAAAAAGVEIVPLQAEVFSNPY